MGGQERQPVGLQPREVEPSTTLMARMDESATALSIDEIVTHGVVIVMARDFSGCHHVLPLPPRKPREGRGYATARPQEETSQRPFNP